MSLILIEHVTAMEGGIITEASQEGKNVFLKGTFMQAEIQNRNKRRYPISEINAAVVKVQEQIKTHGGIFGELDHPQNITINMDRISHVITEMYMDGNNAIGKAKLLDTPMGLIAKELARSGVRYGVSSRGAGQVNESGEVSGFQLITVDLVATPSAPGAMPNTVYESLEASIAGKKVLTLAESVLADPDAQKYLEREIMKFLNEGLFKNFKK